MLRKVQGTEELIHGLTSRRFEVSKGELLELLDQQEQLRAGLRSKTSEL